DFNAAQSELTNLKKTRDHFSDTFRRLLESQAALKDAENKADAESREILSIDASLEKRAGQQARMKERKALFEKSYETQKTSLIRAAAIKERMEPLGSSIGLKKEKAAEEQFRITKNSTEAEAALETLKVIEKNIADASISISSFSQFEGTDGLLNEFKNNFEKLDIRTKELAKLEKEAALLTRRIAEIDRQLSEMSKKAESNGRTASGARAEIEECESRKERVSAELETSSILNAARDIRLKLKEGRACPVCGSLEHPALNSGIETKTTGKIPDELKKELQDVEAEIKGLEKKAAHAESEKNSALSLSAIIKQNGYEKKGELMLKNDEIKKANGECRTLLKALEPPVPLKGLAAGEVIKKWEEALKTLKSASTTIEKCEKERIMVKSQAEKILMQKENATAIKTELAKEIAAIDSELALLSAEFCALTQNKDPDELLNGLEAEKNFIESESGKLDKTVSELNSHKISRQAFIIKLREDISKFKDVISSCENFLLEKCRETGIEIHIVKEMLPNIKNIENIERIYALKSMEKNRIEAAIKEKESVLAREPFDPLKLETVKNEEASKNLEIEKANREIGELSNQLAEIEKLGEEFRKITEEFELLKKDFATVEQLYLITKDNQFRDFVLSFHMESLLALASQYMKKLTGGRYEFASDPESANQIFIKDYLNEGLEREISTISGGESFMASLSLALALSQVSAGNKSIDFMFLDEGFGVLDSEALEDVLDMINNLNDIGKKIGVISHIREVRERIPTRIEILKQPDGSSIIKV
ncbi:MAG TPA: SbcC/MukB-like Walker B domain-containing protein, partial [Candidatus Wallbacteria bacterium]|nr:SbcC/MukB-like Walker B domain-containing protein [Candidatus Wallbacteria bacterium]